LATRAKYLQPSKHEKAFFRKKIKNWTSKGERTFFWRSESLSGNAMLIVEILLVRNRAENAEPVARDFLSKHSTPVLLAGASEDELEVILRPLGLSTRLFLSGSARARFPSALYRHDLHIYGGVLLMAGNYLTPDHGDRALTD